MRITIHRGTNQIGGCVTEYAFKGWRLFVDYGQQLPGAPKAAEDLEIEGLTYGDVSKSALLITHDHSDHIGKIDRLPSELPVLMGKVAKEIALAYCNRLGYVFEEKKLLAERIKKAGTFRPGHEFSFGQFSIMPIVIDHSAFDAYAFKIVADDVSVFHTGDFRTHGFRSRKLSKLLEEYVGRVDYVVCEATNVSRTASASSASGMASMTEKQLSNKYVKEFATNKFNIVYVSSTNIDRLFALYRAACQNGRVFLVDSYQKHIMDIVTRRDTLWGKSSYFKYRYTPPQVVEYHDGEVKIAPSVMQQIETQGFVLVARAGDKFDHIISHLLGEDKAKEKAVYLSMWSGYLDKTNEAYNPKLAASVGGNYKYLHTSGHCDMESLKEVFSLLNPRAIIPIHTDDPKAFATLFCQTWPVLLLEDGDSIEPTSDRCVDATLAEVYAKSPVAMDGQDKCWSLASKCLGYFAGIPKAKFILEHVVYAPDRMICYVAEDEEDMGPNHIVVWDKHHTQVAEYFNGGHTPGESRYHEASPFKPGDKVLALIFEGRYLAVEGEVIGPVDEELMNQFLQCSDPLYESFDDYRDYLMDWDWDSIAIKPLCNLPASKDNKTEIYPIEVPQRIYLFPLED